MGEKLQRWSFPNKPTFKSDSGGWLKADEAEARIEALEGMLSIDDECFEIIAKATGVNVKASGTIALEAAAIRWGNREARITELESQLKLSGQEIQQLLAEKEESE